MNMDKLRCIVLEDEDDIREWLIKKLRQFPELEIVGEATHIDDAYRLIVATQPDVAFMDIQLIGGDAFTLLSRLKENGVPIPYIVMATGYPEYVLTALNDYRYYIVQYLVKPFVEDWRTKIRKSIDALIAAKLKDSTTINPPTSIKPDIEEEKSDNIFIQHKGNLLRLEFAKIDYLEAGGGGETIIVMNQDSNYQVSIPLSKFMELLPPSFVRISKFNIINTDRIVSINRGDRTVEIRGQNKNKSLGISKIYYPDFIKNLPIS